MGPVILNPFSADHCKAVIDICTVPLCYPYYGCNLY